jgi:Concanavalin A-like lectin/glucanases superfamily
VARTFVAASSQKLYAATAALTAAPLTLACWYRTTTSAWKGLISLAHPSNGFTGEFAVGLTSAGAGIGATRVVAEVNGGTGGTSAVSSISYSQAGVWEHAAAVFTSSTARAAYLNGTNKGTATLSATPSGITDTWLGADIFGDFHDGDLAEVGIWSIALSDLEVAVLAQGISPLLVRPEALVYYAPLLGQYAPEIDLVGRRNLTVTGATAAAHPRVWLPWQRPAVAKATTGRGVTGQMFAVF